MRRSIRFRCGLCVLASAIGLTGRIAAANEKFWVGDNGDWSDSTRWAPAGPPGAGDSVFFVENDSISRTVTYAGGSPDYVGPITINQSGTGALTLKAQSGNLASDNLRIGFDGGTGAVEQTGGTFTPNYVFMGSGSLIVSGGVFQPQSNVHVGWGGTSTITQTAGTFTNGATMYVSDGSYNLAGGTVSTNRIYVSSAFNQSGGQHNASLLVVDPGAAYNLQGGTLQINSALSLNGTLDFGSGTGTLLLAAGATANLSGSVVNAHSATFSAGDNSLIVVNPGFDPATAFGTFTTTGLVHTAGTTLAIPAGRAVTIGGVFSDPLNVSGSLLLQGDCALTAATQIEAGGSIIGGSIRAANLATAGTVNVDSLRIGFDGAPAGSMQQTGGNVATGYVYMGAATYTLSAGAFNPGANVHVGWGGSSTFNQSGGTFNTAAILYVGYSNGAGVYNLSGGSLDTYQTAVAPGSSGAFDQSGGTHSTALLTVNEGGTYILRGGTLNIRSVFSLRGTLDFAGGPGLLSLGDGATADLSGTIVDPQHASFVGGADSLLVVPAGFDPFTAFASCTTNGLVHSAGTTLVIPSGHSVRLGGTFNDPVSVLGSMAIESDLTLPAQLQINTGSTVSGGSLRPTSISVLGGTVSIDNLYMGYAGGATSSVQQNGGSISTAYVNIGNDSIYSFTDGTLTTSNIAVGYGGDGIFNQSGGTLQSSAILYVGYSYGTGAFSLNGGNLGMGEIRVGHGGPGTFSQSGGAVTTPLLNVLTDTGGYNLSDGTLHATDVNVAHLGAGRFTQSGGTTTVNGSLTIGYLPTDTGTYTLSGGNLIAGTITNNNRFNYTGGNLTAEISNAGDFDLSGSGSRFVHGTFANFGTVNTAAEEAHFLGAFTNAGAYISSGSSNFFTLLALAGGYIQAGPGDQFVISADLTGTSTARALWQSDAAELAFDNGGAHTLSILGDDLGVTYDGYDDNFAWGQLMLGSAQSLTLTDGNALEGGAMYVRELLLADGVDQISDITGNGFILYYDLAAPANAYLNRQTYPLTGGGFIEPVPEPATVTLFLLPALAFMRRWRGRRL